MRGALLVLVVAACGGPPHPGVEPTLVVDAALPTPLESARAACRAGGDAACDALADYWGARELASDGEPGREDALLLADACDRRDDAAACFGLALMHKYGTAGARDDAAAKQYFARVRALGDLNGLRGEPVSDEGRAVLARTESSCQAGRARACTQLGWAAFSAVQQEKDAAVAYRWWRRGCDLGNSTGCRWAGHVATTYLEVGAEADAEALLRRSCELANPGGCDELGRLLVRRGDATAAAPIFEAACADGSRDGCSDLAAMIAPGACALADTRPLEAAAVATLRAACASGGDPAVCAAVEPCP